MPPEKLMDFCVHLTHALGMEKPTLIKKYMVHIAYPCGHIFTPVITEDDYCLQVIKRVF